MPCWRKEEPCFELNTSGLYYKHITVVIWWLSYVISKNCGITHWGL